MGETEEIQQILLDQERMVTERALWDPIYKDVDHWIYPAGAGGFQMTSPTYNLGTEYLYDITAVDGLDRCTAVLAGITIPRNQRWHGLAFADKDLNRLPAVRRWCERATDRLFACRYAPSAGFEVQAHEDIRQEVAYGTSALWVDELPGRSLFYKALHLSEIYIDENHCGRVDTVHRLFELEPQRALDMFGEQNVSAKMREKAANRDRTRYPFLHVVRPNRMQRRGRMDWQGKPIESLYLEIDEKHICRRGGFWTMPIVVSRHVTGPRQKYGRSPAMKVLGSARGLNRMMETILIQGEKAVDPAYAFYDDGDISTLATKHGGLNPGLVDEYGRLLVKELPVGDVSLGRDMLEDERGVVKQVFLEEFFRLLSDPSDRMTATQVLETLQKEGVLVAPFAGRRETEKLGPMIERELDIALRARQIDPYPPEVIEAGARPVVEMDNPLSRMARAEEASGFTRWAEIGVQAASAGAPEALDRINWDRGMQVTAEVLGVRPSCVNTDDEVAAIRARREEQRQAEQAAAVMPAAAGAALDLAKSNEIAAQLAAGGGL